MKFGRILPLIAAAVVCPGAATHTQITYAHADTGEISISDIGETSVDIIADGKTFTYTDSALMPSDFTVAEEIENRRINMPLEKKRELVDEYLRRGADYKTALDVCFPLLSRTVDKVAESLYVSPEDARAEYNNGIFTAGPHRVGRRLDEGRLYAALYYCLKYGVNNSVTAATVEIPPSVTKESLEQNLKLRSAYTTDYSSSTSDRAHNVELALKKLDGVRLAKGDALSFNALVGARTVENGYRKAKVIVDGKYVDGVGGGACQASTAVYNAALLAGLTASANAHTICPTYCAPGLDAMISVASDLIITNDTDADVYFSVAFGGGTATVKVIGAPKKCEYIPESVIVRTVPHEELDKTDSEHKYFDGTAATGDRMVIAPGRDGYESETYVKCVKDGQVIKRVRIRKNYYAATPQITMVAP